jgi:release factor glutamine methyltransferase
VKGLSDMYYYATEDSFILLDAIEQDVDELRSSRPTICLEIG